MFLFLFLHHKLFVFHLIFLHFFHEFLSFFGSLFLKLTPLLSDRNIKPLAFDLTLIQFISKTIDIFPDKFLSDMGYLFLFFFIDGEIVLSEYTVYIAFVYIILTVPDIGLNFIMYCFEHRVKLKF